MFPVYGVEDARADPNFAIGSTIYQSVRNPTVAAGTVFSP